MRKQLAILSILLAFFMFLSCQNAQAEDPVKDAKEAYAKFVKAAKANNVVEAKKYIAKNALADIEKDGALDLFLAMHADITPETIKAAKADVKGGVVILKIEQVEKTKDGTSSTSTTVYMVKEGGQRKIGMPEGAK